MTTRTIQIYQAQPAMAAVLSQLAFRSKAYWGYDAAFMRACVPELTLTPNDVQRNPTFVAVVDGDIVGFYMLEPLAQDQVELVSLFVDPLFIGKGYGKHLMQHAIATARTGGFQHMFIQADPNAELFYRAMGAQTQTYTPSGSIPGRLLPWMLVNLK